MTFSKGLNSSFLRTIIGRSKSPVTFCHNDLQEGNYHHLKVQRFLGNILLPKASSGNIRMPSVSEEFSFAGRSSLSAFNPADPRLVLIDFEYASYNYRCFSNFLRIFPLLDEKTEQFVIQRFRLCQSLRGVHYRLWYWWTSLLWNQLWELSQRRPRENPKVQIKFSFRCRNSLWITWGNVEGLQKINSIRNQKSLSRKPCHLSPFLTSSGASGVFFRSNSRL